MLLRLSDIVLLLLLGYKINEDIISLGLILRKVMDLTNTARGMFNAIGSFISVVLKHHNPLIFVVRSHFSSFFRIVHHSYP